MDEIGASAVQGFVAMLAAGEPAPGSGAAGAVSLAMGAACARKAIAITRKHSGAGSDLQDADDRLEWITTRAIALAGDDSRCFPRLLDAVRHADGKADPDVGALAIELVAIAGELLRMAAEADALVDRIENKIDARMANDVLAARALFSACRAIQGANEQENRGLLA